MESRKDRTSLARSPCLQEAASKASTTPPNTLFTHMLQGMLHSMLHSMLNHVGSIWEPHAFYILKNSLGSGSAMLRYAMMLFSICSVCNHLAPLSICSCESSAEMLGTLDDQA